MVMEVEVEEAKKKKKTNDGVVVRVLCLHGFRTNGSILKQQIEAKWPNEFLKRLDLHFPDAPLPAKGESGLEHLYHPPFFEWFYSSQDFGEYFKFEEAINFIEEYMVEHGPFDCLLGFSQGAIIAAYAPGMQSQGVAFTRVPTIKSVILISASDFGAFGSGRPSLADNAFASPICCPSLHFIGENDFLRDHSMALVQHFVDPIVIHLQHGHTIPKPDEDEVEKMLRFVEKISSNSNSNIPSTSRKLDSQAHAISTRRSAL